MGVNRLGSSAEYRPSRDLSAASMASGGRGGGEVDCSREDPPAVALEERFDRMNEGVSYGVSAGDGNPLAPMKLEYSLK